MFRVSKDEEGVLLPLRVPPLGGGRGGAGGGGNGPSGDGGGLQPDGAELVLRGFHDGGAAVGPVLRQAEAAAAVPVRVHPEPGAAPVRQLPQRQQGRLQVRRSHPVVLGQASPLAAPSPPLTVDK